VPDSSHDIEIVGPVTVAPAAGDVNLTSAETKGTSVANSHANRRIMIVNLRGWRWVEGDVELMLLPSGRSPVVDV
jgi:hypothetical protein